MFDKWADIDFMTSMSIPIVSFVVYLCIYLRFQLSSSIKMLKIITAMFVVGNAA